MTCNGPFQTKAIARLKFHSRNRQPDESVSTFIAKLRELSKSCDFGANLNEMLQDRVICGIGDPRMQRRLLAETDLTFQMAQDLARALEAADSDTQEAESSVHPHFSQVNNLKKQSAFKPSNCYCCGGSHSQRVCKFRDAACHYCKKNGHIASVQNQVE